MADIQVNIAVIDGKNPREWRVLDETSLGKFVDEIGTISAVSESYFESKKINVDVLPDDVSTLQDGQCKAISGIMVDGDLLLQYTLDAKNPCLARLQHLLRLMKKDKDAMFRQFGLRVWIIGKDTTTFRYRYASILDKIVRILEVKPSEIKVTFVKSLEVAQVELSDLAEEFALKEDFVFLEGS